VAFVVPRPIGGRPLSEGGPAKTGASPKYLQPGPRAGTRPTRGGPGRLDLRWGWALPKWFSFFPYIACISSEVVELAFYGRIGGGYFGRRWLGFGEGCLGGEAALFVAV